MQRTAAPDARSPPRPTSPRPNICVGDCKIGALLSALILPLCYVISLCHDYHAKDGDKVVDHPFLIPLIPLIPLTHASSQTRTRSSLSPTHPRTYAPSPLSRTHPRTLAPTHPLTHSSLKVVEVTRQQISTTFEKQNIPRNFHHNEFQQGNGCV